MKNFKAYLLGVGILFFSLQVTAQSIQPFSSTVKHNKENRPCIQVNLDPQPKVLKKAWKKFLKDHYDFKLKGIGFLANKDLLSAEEIKVKAISPRKMDFFTKVVEKGTGSEMKVFVRYGYDIYLNKEEHPIQYDTVYNMIKIFLKEYLPKFYEKEIKESEKRIKALTKETEDLNEDIKDDTEEIADLKEEIQEREKNLEKNNKLLKSSNQELLERQEKSQRIKSQLNQL